MIIKFRRGTAAQWVVKNSVLREGEPGFELDTGKWKIGDGVRGWNFLPYFVDSELISQMIQDAVDGLVLSGGGVTESAVTQMINDAIGAIVFPTGLSQDDVIQLINQNAPEPDLSGFQTAAQVQTAVDNAINSIDYSAFQTEQQVTDAIQNALAEINAPDMSNYVTTAGLTSALAGLNSTYATDAELSSAVSTAIAGLNLDSYSTDAERDAAISAAISGLNATYATDAELSAAISGLNLSSYSTDAERDSAIATAISGLNATYATDAELAAAIAAVPKKNITGTLDPTNDQFASFTIVADATPTNGWKNRLEFLYQPVSGTAQLTGYFNEYGELRVIPGKSNTVPFRMFTKTGPGDAAHTVNMFEIQDDRNTRTTLMSIDSTGKVTAPGIDIAVVGGPTLKSGYLVLSAAAAVPAGTPANTPIFRTTT